MTALELAEQVVRTLDEKKAVDIRLIEISDITVLADYFVIATGTSSTHVKSLADEVEYKLEGLGVRAAHKEGYRSNSWILIDYGNVVVHVFTPESRSFYDLDRLWRDGKTVDISGLLK
jgi:ribosome-associated protein